jgi:hypothetical protein
MKKTTCLYLNVAKAGGQKDCIKTEPILDCTAGLFQSSGPLDWLSILRTSRLVRFFPSFLRYIGVYTPIANDGFADKRFPLMYGRASILLFYCSEGWLVIWVSCSMSLPLAAARRH